jgi:hypothetical protein
MQEGKIRRRYEDDDVVGQRRDMRRGLVSALAKVSNDVAHDTADVAGLVLSRALSLLVGALGLGLGALLAGVAFVVGWGLGLGLSGRVLGSLRGLRSLGFLTAIVVDRSSLATKLGDCRAREDVVELSVEGVDMNTLILIVVGAWEGDELIARRNTSARTGNLELSARGVELCTPGLGGKVQRDELVHDEVVASLDVAGDLGGAGPANKVKSGLGPLASLETVLGDLEPLSVLVVELGTVTIAVGHVGEGRSSVVWPLLAWGGLPQEGEAAAWVSGSALRSELSARATVDGTAVGTVGRVDARNLADDGRGLGALAWSGTSECLSINGDLRHIAVSGNKRGESEGESGEKGERLHCVSGVNAGWCV